MYKRVLVTGSSGFLGSHIADTLTEKGYKVILFDCEPSKWKNSNQEEIIGDILNFDDVCSAIKDCDVVYHFAAQADIDSADKSPIQTLEPNILGTLNVLEAARINNIKRFIFSSTIYVYSELGSFYRVSKQSCEKIIEEYQKSYQLNYTILRYGSLYGPRANEFNFISNSIIQALQYKKIVRRGDGKEIREYIHVKDAARLSIKALEEKYKNKHLIITGNQQIKVRDLLIMIKEIFNGGIEIEFQNEENTHHYEITPYNYKSQVAMKISPDTYFDLGQGLMDQIYDIEMAMSKSKEKKVSLRERK